MDWLSGAFLISNIISQEQQRLLYEKDKEEMRKQRLEDIQRQKDSEERARQDAARDVNNSNVAVNAAQRFANRAAMNEIQTGISQAAQTLYTGSV